MAFVAILIQFNRIQLPILMTMAGITCEEIFGHECSSLIDPQKKLNHGFCGPTHCFSLSRVCSDIDGELVHQSIAEHLIAFASSPELDGLLPDAKRFRAYKKAHQLYYDQSFKDRWPLPICVMTIITQLFGASQTGYKVLYNAALLKCK